MNMTWALSYTLVSVAAAAIIFTIYRHVTYDMGGKKEIDAFRNFLLSFLGFVLFNGVCIWANHYHLGVLGTIFTTFNLIGISATALFWFYYIETRLSSYYFKNKHLRMLMFVPMTIVMLLIASSPLTHLIFYYDEEGRYQRGPLYAIILITAVLYLLVATIHTYRCIGRARIKSEKKQYYNLMMFIVFPFLAGVIDFIRAHLPSMELVTLFGIVMIYLNLQQAQIYRDILTGLNNRRMTDEYLTERIGLVSESEPMFIIMADLNQFKSINDRFGHLEGDRALKIVAETLKKYGDRTHHYVSRWGGDEFMVIVDNDKHFDPEKLRDTLNGDLKKSTTNQNLKYNLSLSIGCVKCVDPRLGADKVISMADQQMYMDKQNRSDDYKE